jgi:hypothetical protein
MTETIQDMSETAQALDGVASQRRILFVDQIADGDLVLMAFKDPAPCYAITTEAPATATGKVAAEPRCNVLDAALVTLPTLAQGTPFAANQHFTEWMGKGDDTSAALVLVKYRGVELMWRPGRALLQCDSEQAESLLSAVVEFAHYECELWRIEDGIANTWAELEQDKALAFEVTPADLERSAVVGARMNRVLQRRIRLARIEPHLYEPAASLATAGRKLGEELREKARIEARLESVDAQLEVFEGIYEMSGQRMGEYRAARQEHVLEWIIIVLLAAEMVLLLVQTVWKSGI